MRVPSKFLALILATAMQPVIAAPVTLDFEDITGKDLVDVGDRYYASSGVRFGSNAWGVAADPDASAGCTGELFFRNKAKSETNCGALLLVTKEGGAAQGFSFNITSDYGFLGGIEFTFATGSDAKGLVEALDAKGNQISAFELSNSCPSYDCNWGTGNLQFASATSIRFTAGDQLLMLDDIKINTASAPQQPLPEPASVALTLCALGALGWTRKRAAR